MTLRLDAKTKRLLLQCYCICLRCSAMGENLLYVAFSCPWIKQLLGPVTIGKKVGM